MSTLSQLAGEYDDSIALTEQIVKKTREELRKARRECDSDKVKSLSSKLAVLYEEIRDMRIISQKLRDYYNDEEKIQEAV